MPKIPKHIKHIAGYFENKKKLYFHWNIAFLQMFFNNSLNYFFKLVGIFFESQENPTIGLYPVFISMIFTCISLLSDAGADSL